MDRSVLFFHHPHDHHINGMGSSGAVRAGDYKLVETYGTGEAELYNLAEDPGEQKDLAEALPEKAAEMKERLRVWRKETSIP